MAHFMTDGISPFPPRAVSHTHSLCLSAILLSSPPSLFDIKMLSDDFELSMNKLSPLRTILISKVTSIQNGFNGRFQIRLVRFIQIENLLHFDKCTSFLRNQPLQWEV